MKFIETALGGAFIIEPDPIMDSRGYFIRTFCRNEFQERGLVTNIAQCNASYNHSRGTLRGMHYQAEPHAEVKLVRCTSGAIYDVIIDLRRDSANFKKWIGIELSAANRIALYIPKGFAHGFQTMEDGTEVFYQMSEFHHPESAKGVRWNDPAFGITWPLDVTAISDRDRNYPNFAG